MLPFLTKVYSLSFDVYPIRFIPGVYANVIQLTAGGHYGNYSDRTPSAYLHDGTLGIISSVNGLDYRFEYVKKLQVGTWTSLEIVQFIHGLNYLYQIFINRTKVHEVINTDAREFSSVKVYASNPWQDAQPGFIRNIVIKGTFYFPRKLLLL